MSSKKKVLIIDDEEDLSFFIKANLEFGGNYEVITAGNADDGFGLALYYKPDIILLDIMMPGTNGLNLLKRFREDKQIGVIPVIMLTAVTDEIMQGAAFNMFCADYIVKPVQIEDLRRKIEEVLAKQCQGRPGEEEKARDNDFPTNKEGLKAD